MARAQPVASVDITVRESAGPLRTPVVKEEREQRRWNLMTAADAELGDNGEMTSMLDAEG